MRHISINKIILAGAFLVTLSSCSKKLDLFPQNDLTNETTYSTAAGYRAVLAKVYAGLATTGNAGPAGSSDIMVPVEGL